MIHQFKLLFISLVSALSLCEISLAEESSKSYLLATAGSGGTYYPIGVAIATIANEQAPEASGFSLSAISSAGSGENLALIQKDQAQFALIQNIWAQWALSSENQFAEKNSQTHNFKAIAVLWPNIEHFAIRKDYFETGHLADFKKLKNKGFAIGRKGSGTEVTNSYILQKIGIANPETYFNLSHIGYTASVTAFAQGQIDGLNTAAGAPVGAMTALKIQQKDTLKLLNITDEQLVNINDERNIFSRFIIPAGTYPFQDEDIQSIAQPNLLIVRNDVPNEDVYLITKSIFESLNYLNKIHPVANYISLNTALTDLEIPLHAGAIQYYQETSIEIPEHLK